MSAILGGRIDIAASPYLVHNAEDVPQSLKPSHFLMRCRPSPIRTRTSADDQSGFLAVGPAVVAYGVCSLIWYARLYLELANEETNPVVVVALPKVHSDEEGQDLLGLF